MSHAKMQSAEHTHTYRMSTPARLPGDGHQYGQTAGNISVYGVSDPNKVRLTTSAGNASKKDDEDAHDSLHVDMRRIEEMRHDPMREGATCPRPGQSIPSPEQSMFTRTIVCNCRNGVHVPPCVLADGTVSTDCSFRDSSTLFALQEAKSMHTAKLAKK